MVTPSPELRLSTRQFDPYTLWPHHRLLKFWFYVLYSCPGCLCVIGRLWCPRPARKCKLYRARAYPTPKRQTKDGTEAFLSDIMSHTKQLPLQSAQQCRVNRAYTSSMHKFLLLLWPWNKIEHIVHKFGPSMGAVINQFSNLNKVNNHCHSDCGMSNSTDKFDCRIESGIDLSANHTDCQFKS